MPDHSWHSFCFFLCRLSAKLICADLWTQDKETFMPDFVNPFGGLTPDRPFTKRELTRSLRLAMAAEQDAIHLYEAMADATDNLLAKKVLQDVADEERVHAGEFQRVLNLLLPDESDRLREGAEEVDEMRAELADADIEPPPQSTVGDLTGSDSDE